MKCAERLFFWKLYYIRNIQKLIKSDGRWFEAFPVPSVDATVIVHVRLLVDEIISGHGAPRVLLTKKHFISE